MGGDPSAAYRASIFSGNPFFSVEMRFYQVSTELYFIRGQRELKVSGETQAGSAEEQPIRLRSGQALPGIAGWV